jgi:hypothetical protein
MGGVASEGSWVDPDKIEVRRVAVGALPVVKRNSQELWIGPTR